MNEETEIDERDVKPTSLRDLIKVERTIVYKKRMAPAGCAFFVGTLTKHPKIYTVMRVVRTTGLTDAELEDVKDQVKESVIDYLNSL